MASACVLYAEWCPQLCSPQGLVCLRQPSSPVCDAPQAEHLPWPWGRSGSSLPCPVHLSPALAEVTGFPMLRYTRA